MKPKNENPVKINMPFGEVIKKIAKVPFTKNKQSKKERATKK